MERGRLKLIVGNMFSNKTGTLILEIETLRSYSHHRNVLVAKPTTDTRSTEGFIVNSKGEKMEAIELPATHPEKIFNIIRREESKIGTVVDTIAFDEVQFITPKIFGVVGELLRKGYDVIVAGLMLNFRGEPFGSTLNLIGLCDSINDVQKLTSYCSSCGAPGPLPQRTIDGKPAPYTDEETLVGGKENYGIACHKCHILPGKPIYN